MKNGFKILTLLVLCATFAFADPIIWVPSNTEKVLQDQLPPDELPEPVLRIEAAKNEYEGGQVIIHATEDMKNVQVKVTDLVHASVDKRIEASQIKVYLQHYIEVYKSTNNVFPLGWYPDALPPLTGSFGVEKGKNQGLWLTVKIPKGQEAGSYKGELTIACGQDAWKVPIELTVWDFELTDESHAHTAFAIWNNQVAQAHGVQAYTEEYWKLIEDYYWFQTEYRLPPDDLPIPTENIEEYLGKASKFLDNPKVSSFRIPYYDNNPAKTKQLVDELRKRGWLSKGYFYLGKIDEPTPDKYPLVREISSQLKQIAPDVRHVVTKKPIWELEGFVDTWCIPTHQYNVEEVEERRAAGDHIWWYTCVSPKYPYPTYHIDDHLIGARILPWMQKDHDVEGTLYWSTTIYLKYDGQKYITRDPWQDPLAYPGANGDGYLLYPGPDGPVATIRLEAIRDGMEDYEYLWLLEQRLKEIANRLGVHDQFNVKNAFITYYPRLFTALNEYNPDPDNFHEVRREVAQEIVALYKGPFHLISFDRISVKEKTEISVFVEAGTKVKLDGEVLTRTGTVGKADYYLIKRCFKPGIWQLDFTFELNAKTKEVAKRILVFDPLEEVERYPAELCYFEVEADLERWRPTNVTLSISQDFVSQGEKSMKAVYHSEVDFPNIRLLDEYVGYRTSDWSEYDTIAFDVYNPSDRRTADIRCKFFEVGYRRSDDSHGFTIRPQRWVTVRIPLNKINLDLRSMKGMEIWMWKLEEPMILYLDNFRFESLEPDPLPMRPLAK